MFFASSQVATLVATGPTSDTISSEGYLFTYTRDKLFTGGVGMTNPIGRMVRVSWPQGVEAQAVTTGPNLSGAQVTIRRVDGGAFDLAALTFKLLANTGGAGGTVEIMPMRNGQDVAGDPFYFDATGYAGNQFSYSTAPNPWGSTVALPNCDTYKIGLYVDFALTALTLKSNVPTVNHAPTDIALSNGSVLENEPVGTVVGTFSTTDPDVGDTFTYAFVAGAGDSDNGVFSINGSDLVTAASFNFEVRSSYSIRIESTDAGLLSTQKSFAITVLDVPEPPPVVQGVSLMQDGRAVIRWSSIPNHLYSLCVATNLRSGFFVLRGDIPATPVLNVYTDAVQGVPTRFWRITTGR